MIEQTWEIAAAALDGRYGWQNEAFAIVVLVVIFNFFAKWVLRKLHIHFETQNKTWMDSFVQALYTPLSCFTWFLAAVYTTNMILSQIDIKIELENLHIVVGVATVLSVAWFAFLWKKKLVKLSLAKSKSHEIALEPAKIDVMNKLFTIFIIFVTTLLLLEITGRNINTLIAFGGIGGLAIAFASQAVISNFFSGFMIYLTHPFSVGDWINLPEHKLEGHVEEIGWYMTRIRTFEKRPVYVPNSIFSKIVVETPSRMSHRQFNEILQLSSREIKSVRKVIEDLKKMLREHPQVDQDQLIFVHLERFGEYSLDVKVSAYLSAISSDAFACVKQDILLKILDILAQNSVEMASPTTVIEIPQGVNFTERLRQTS